MATAGRDALGQYLNKFISSPPEPLAFRRSGGRGRGEGSIPCQIPNHAFCCSFDVCRGEGRVSLFDTFRVAHPAFSPNMEEMMKGKVEIVGPLGRSSE